MINKYWWHMCEQNRNITKGAHVIVVQYWHFQINKYENKNHVVFKQGGSTYYIV